MQTITISRVIVGTVALMSLLALSWWMSIDPTRDFAQKIPGLDNQPINPAGSTPTDVVTIGENLERFEGTSSMLSGAWPHFRGANFDNISTENIRLADQWDANGPPVLWSIDLGEGHAAPAVLNGRVYILDYDETEKADALRCFSLADGKEIWRRWYHVHVKRNHGMSRTIPAVTEKYVVTMGPRCHVMCVTADSGAFLWGIDLEKEFETKVPFWYTGQCPLIDDSLAVIAPGGKALMLGVHYQTGDIIWQTPNPDDWQMSHSSIMPIKFMGKKMYVYCFVEGMVGISAEGDDRGKVLWKTTAWSHSVIAPSPVFIPEDRIFISAGYAAGSMLLQLKYAGEQYSIAPIQTLKPDEGLASEQQTPILYQGHLFAVLPKDAGALRNQFVCCHPDDCQKMVWTSGKTNRFGLGPFLIADGKFFLLRDDGVLTLLRATTTEYVQLAQAQIFDGHDAWGPMAIAGGRLLLRDSKKLFCLDVRLNQFAGGFN